jgi:hypothetical protein
LDRLWTADVALERSMVLRKGDLTDLARSRLHDVPAIGQPHRRDLADVGADGLAHRWAPLTAPM